MSKRKVVFLGDCQAAALAQVYREFVAPLTADSVGMVSVDRASEADIRHIGDADVVVSQVFNLPRKVTADLMRDGAKKIEFPAVFVGFLWPFAVEQHVNNKSVTVLPDGPYGGQVGDAFLNRLIVEGVAPQEALKRYLSIDIAHVAHLDRLLELHIGAQALRDEKTGFTFSRLIETRFRDERLFLTSSHPTLPLLVPLIQGVFQRLDVPPAVIELAVGAQRLTPFPQTALPIHPGVIRHFGLRFVDEQSRYTFMYEGSFTFEQFVTRYMMYTWNEGLLQGIALANGADMEHAFVAMERALRTSPESVEGWQTLSRLLQRMGRLPEARSAAYRSILLDSRDPTGPIELSRVLLAEGEMVGAEVESRRAIALHTRNGRSYSALAEVLAAAGSLEQALETAEQAVALRPGDAYVLHVLSRLLARVERLSDAEDVARLAIQIAPDQLGPRYWLADVLARQDRRKEALAIVTELVARDPLKDSDAFVRLGRLQADVGKLAAAEKSFRQAVDLAPADAGLIAGLADVIVRQGRAHEALSLLQRAIEAAPASARTPCVARAYSCPGE